MGHWRVALRSAAWMALLAVPFAVAVLYVYGAASAGAFGYGVLVGLISFVSTAITVSLLAGASKATGVLLGMTSFGARYGFVAVALGVPAYLGIGSAIAMMAGFAGVYFVETIILVPLAVRLTGIPGADAPSAAEKVERRTKV